MKKLVLAVGVVMGLLAGMAMAEEMFVVDGKKILVTSDLHQAELLIHSKDFPKGIFIRATTGGGVPMGGGTLLNAGKIIKERFESKGFKVVEKFEDADIAIQFSSMGGNMNIVKANNNAAHSIMPDSGKLAANAGALAGAVMSGGVFAGVGYIAGAFIPTDESAFLTATVSKKPKFHQGGFFGIDSIISSVDDGDIYKHLGVKYRLDKEDQASDELILKLMVELWIKYNMVLDAPVATNATPAATTITPTSSTPAPAITAAAATEEPKKQ